MEGNIIQLKEYHLNKGASKDHTPVFPMTKASAIEGMAELLKDLKINGVTPTSNISDVSSPEKGKIYYEESTDKYYVYSEDKSSFVELGAGASVEPSDVMPTITQEASTQSGGDNIITFTFPNGETTQVIIKNGTQGNSGYTGAAGELEVVNNLEDGGATAALSAEMGKELAQQSIIESGTFAKAYLKAVNVNVPFPWVLKDTDGNGNSITKMIWHIGNREFVDAAGADVDWYKDGITFITEGPCALYIKHTNNALKYIIIPKAGLHNVSFSDLRKTDDNPYGKVSQLYFLNTTTETIDGVETIVPISLQNEYFVDGTPNSRYTGVTYVNFGGLIITGIASFYGYYPSNMSKVQTIENLVMQGTSNSWNMWLNTTTSLRNINNIRGTLGYSIQSGGNQTFSASIGGLTYVTKLDLSKLTCPMMYISAPNLKYLDIRGMNPTINYSGTNANPNYDYTLADNWITGTSNLRTLVIGDFDTSNIVGVSSGNSFISNLTNCTLVCTKATPPATNPSGYVIDDLLNKVTTILVPPGAKTTYQNADWWGNYASKMSEYNEGDY